jgi:hypothetical protein
MLKPNKLTGLSLTFLFLITATLFCAKSASAVGISIDAGLTPAENRWMLRSQLRYSNRNNDPPAAQREMNMYMFPAVVAYGFRPDWTVMIRQALVRREMSMMGQTSSNSGFADLLVMSKFRLTRINTPNYTLGIAPTLGLEIPTGKADFTSNSYDLRFGSLFSGRMRSLGMDLNITYVWNGLTKTSDSESDPGDEFFVEAAVAYQISVGADANFAIAPVMESSYQKISSNSKDGNIIANTGESAFLLSPGIKVTLSSFILESLIQFPLWQEQNGLQTERATSFLIGFRIMN